MSLPVNPFQPPDLAERPKCDGARAARPSKATQAYKSIRDQLVMLDIAPGAPMHEEQLSADLGVGRTPIREALKRLEHERLVVTFSRRGTFATEINIKDLAHISEVRQEIEPIGAALAAKRASAHDRELLANVGHELQTFPKQGMDARRLMDLDVRAHRAIYAGTRNPYLEDTLVHYDALATRIWCTFIDRLTGMAGHVEDHIPLIRAVVIGDDHRAAALAAAHVKRFEQDIRALL